MELTGQAKIKLNRSDPHCFDFVQYFIHFLGQVAQFRNEFLKQKQSEWVKVIEDGI